MDVKDTIKNFVYKPDGTTTFVDALCSHLREEMAFGRLKGGSKFPTMAEISEMTGLTFGRARRVIECLSREGYLCSKQHVGTYIVQRSSILRGRVLFAMPDVDTCRYHPSQLTSVLGRRLMEKGYSFSIATFPLDPKGDLSYLKSELLRATNLVIAARATPQVQKLLAESGVKHVFLYGDMPETDVAPWAVASFARSSLSEILIVPTLSAHHASNASA